jgi:DNA-binding transcriptional LysR family regulator
LNQLKVLQALIEEESVSKAAARLGLTQPAVSNALARLRVQLDDALLIRSGNQMALTEFGMDLRSAVTEALAKAMAALQPKGAFDPRTLNRSFTLYASENATVATAASIVLAARQTAPRIELIFRPLSPRTSLQFASGDGDLLLKPLDQGLLLQPAKGLVEAPMFTDRIVALVCATNRSVGEVLDLETFRAAPHAMLDLGWLRSASVEGLLRRNGMSLNVPLIAGSMWQLATLVVGSGVIAITVERIARRLAALSDLRVLPPPIELPIVPEVVCWRQSDAADPANRWLRNLILGTVGAAPSGQA